MVAINTKIGLESAGRPLQRPSGTFRLSTDLASDICLRKDRHGPRLANHPTEQPIMDDLSRRMGSGEKLVSERGSHIRHSQGNSDRHDPDFRTPQLTDGPSKDRYRSTA